MANQGLAKRGQRTTAITPLLGERLEQNGQSALSLGEKTSYVLGLGILGS